MPTITIQISITVPEGAKVSVQSGGQASGQQPRAFTPRPDPEFPGWDPLCPQHGVEWTLRPAGVSRTKVDESGNPKRYNAFWACPERGCNEKPERRPDNDGGGAVDDALGF